MAEITIPDEVYDAFDLPEGDRDSTMKRELAISLYNLRVLSFGKARELAGLSKGAFHQLLGERGIERHYTQEELDEDREYARR